MHCEQEVIHVVLYFQADAIKAQCVPLSSPTSSDAATLEVTYFRWCGCKWMRCGCKWVRLEQPALDFVSVRNKSLTVLSRWDFRVYLFLQANLTYSDYYYKWLPFSITDCKVTYTLPQILFSHNWFDEFSNKANQEPNQMLSFWPIRILNIYISCEDKLSNN